MAKKLTKAQYGKEITFLKTPMSKAEKRKMIDDPMKKVGAPRSNPNPNIRFSPIPTTPPDKRSTNEKVGITRPLTPSKKGGTIKKKK